jgi:F-box and WD-40 domain protein CDC4
MSQVLDYGAARDGVPEENLGRRIVVNGDGMETSNLDANFGLDGTAEA